MLGLNLEWERCPDGVGLFVSKDQWQDTKRRRAIPRRAHDLWIADVRPERIPKRFLDAQRLANPQRRMFSGRRSPADGRTAEGVEEAVLVKYAHIAWVESHSPDEIPKEYVERAEGELLDQDWTEPTFLHLSDRRLPLRLELASLENPIALHFVNARDDTARVKFLSRFGMPDNLHRHTGIPAASLYGLQNCIRELLAKAGGEDPVEAVGAVNEALDGRMVRGLGGRQLHSVRPVLDFAPGSATPRLTLEPATLFSFMILEAALVVANEARLTSCGHCDKLFLTGSLTGRRSHAIYCSDKCRVAAMRKRNAQAAEH